MDEDIIVKAPTQPQLNLTQPKFGYYMKMTLHHHHQELNVGNTLAVTDLVLTKLER